MKKFKFKFQVLLTNAEKLEQECAGKLREIRDILSMAENKEKALVEEKNGLIIQLNTSCDRLMNVNTYRENKIYIDEINKKSDLVRREIKEIKITEEEILNELKEAKIKVSTYEKLRSNQYKEYVEKVRKNEEKELEERLMYKYTNNSEVAVN